MSGIASSIQLGLRQFVNRSIVHPFASRYSVFILSCLTFLIWLWCQLPPSTSIANFNSGVAKSMLYMFTAYCGTHDIFSIIKALYISYSRSLIIPLSITVCAAFAFLSGECDLNPRVFRLVSLLRNFSSYVRWLIFNDCASENDRVCIPYSLSHLHIVQKVQLNRIARSALDCLSSIYSRFNSIALGFNGLGHPFARMDIPYRSNHLLTVVAPTPYIAPMPIVEVLSPKYSDFNSPALGGLISLPMNRAYTIHGTMSIAPMGGP